MALWLPMAARAKRRWLESPCEHTDTEKALQRCLARVSDQGGRRERRRRTTRVSQMVNLKVLKLLTSLSTSN